MYANLSPKASSIKRENNLTQTLQKPLYFHQSVSELLRVDSSPRTSAHGVLR